MVPVAVSNPVLAFEIASNALFNQTFASRLEKRTSLSHHPDYRKHCNPQRPWTIKQTARQCGMSSGQTRTGSRSRIIVPKRKAARPTKNKCLLQNEVPCLLLVRGRLVKAHLASFAPNRTNSEQSLRTHLALHLLACFRHCRPCHRSSNQRAAEAPGLSQQRPRLLWLRESSQTRAAAVQTPNSRASSKRNHQCGMRKVSH